MAEIMLKRSAARGPARRVTCTVVTAAISTIEFKFGHLSSFFFCNTSPSRQLRKSIFLQKKLYFNDVYFESKELKKIVSSYSGKRCHMLAGISVKL